MLICEQRADNHKMNNNKGLISPVRDGFGVADVPSTSLMMKELPEMPLEQQIDGLQRLPLEPPVTEINTLNPNDTRINRTEGIHFAPSSPQSASNIKDGVINDISEPPQLPKRAPILPPRKTNNNFSVPAGINEELKMLIFERESLINFTLSEFEKFSLTLNKTDLNLTSGQNTDDEFINTKLNVLSYNYETDNRIQLYNILLKTNVIDNSILDLIEGTNKDEQIENGINDVINELGYLFESSIINKDEEILNQFKLDLLTIYSLLKTMNFKSDLNVNPLVVSILLITGDKLITLTMAFIIHKFILNDGTDDVDYSKQFLFVLYRSIEESNIDQVVELALNFKKENPSQFIKDKKYWLAKMQEWYSKNELNKIIDELIIYGPLKLIPFLNKTEKFQLLRFQIEFDHIFETQIDSDKLSHLTETNEQLSNHLANSKNKYTEILTNFQQLNGESMRVKNLISKNNEIKTSLIKERDELQVQLDNFINNFEVLRVREEKNKQVDIINNKLKGEIERLKNENSKLSKS